MPEIVLKLRPPEVIDALMRLTRYGTYTGSGQPTTKDAKVLMAYIKRLEAERAQLEETLESWRPTNA